MKLPHAKCQYGASSIDGEKLIVESCKRSARRIHGEVAVCIEHWLRLRDAERARAAEPE